MTEETIYLLFKGFLVEAQAVLKVESENLLDVQIGAVFINGKVDPIYINWNKKCVYLCTPVLQILSGGKDAPTPIRVQAYSIANRWKRSIKEGRLCDHDQSDLVTAIAIASIKGLQLYRERKLAVSFPAVKQRIYELTGLNVNLAQAIREDNAETGTVLCVNRDNRSETFIENWSNLIKEESVVVKPLLDIAKGDLGSRDNPFPNVNAAADYILQLETDRLKNDIFRSFVKNTPFYYDPEQKSFRIPWSGAYVSYLDGPEVIDGGFVVNQLKSHRFNLKPNLTNRRFLFRGQAQFYEPCVPNMFRNPKEIYFAKYNVFSCEMKILLDSHPLVQLFNDGMELFNDRFAFEVNYGGLSQHYYNKTQFLDLTTDIDAAKFFAVTTFDMGRNQYVPHNDDGIGVLYYYDIEPSAFMDVDNSGYHLSSIGKQPFMRSGAQHGYLLEMAKGIDFNKLPQVRCVFFKHDYNVTAEIYQNSNNGSNYMSEDLLQNYWYEKLMDDDRKSVISCEAFLLNYKHNRGTITKHALLKKLYESGIEVRRNSKPYFSKDMLHDYYFKDAVEKWEEFCSDIYFYSPEGRILKEHLLNLPKNPAYRKYFYD